MWQFTNLHSPEANVFFHSSISCGKEYSSSSILTQLLFFGSMQFSLIATFAKASAAFSFFDSLSFVDCPLDVSISEGVKLCLTASISLQGYLLTIFLTDKSKGWSSYISLAASAWFSTASKLHSSEIKSRKHALVNNSQQLEHICQRHLTLDKRETNLCLLLPIFTWLMH